MRKLFTFILISFMTAPCCFCQQYGTGTVLYFKLFHHDLELKPDSTNQKDWSFQFIVGNDKSECDGCEVLISNMDSAYVLSNLFEYRFNANHHQVHFGCYPMHSPRFPGLSLKLLITNLITGKKMEIVMTDDMDFYDKLIYFREGSFKADDPQLKETPYQIKGFWKFTGREGTATNTQYWSFNKDQYQKTDSTEKRITYGYWYIKGPFYIKKDSTEYFNLSMVENKRTSLKGKTVKERNGPFRKRCPAYGGGLQILTSPIDDDLIYLKENSFKLQLTRIK